MGRIIEAVYRNGVFKPLKKVHLREGERVKVIIEGDISKYYGIFGKTTSKELKKLEEEVYM
ncbi:MAG: antitoxin family protein [Palaeococcus sp.]|uniref:antitoxin family protein n=1 Tax=Palaeococcus sp. (in: euryarchaeotes) TaxID=2820298 RepID=UPI0025DA8911|nr:antitoxin family protein [Palaeococcus sp. (in: euryarchaeotes)]MCD6559528.1 antitoxin family protein [Palaeococcus sp. (in: euryarchaeotes)]